MTTTSIIGFDSAWTDQVKAPGAVCIVRCNKGSTATFSPPELTSFSRALEIIENEAQGAKKILVAIDQPTVVSNASGSRPVDKVAGSLISWLGGGVQPANRSKQGMFDDDAPIWRFKHLLQAAEEPESARSATGGKHLIEVFPALAIPSLAKEFCGRLLGARYNPSRRKTFQADHWSKVIECAASAGDRLGIDGLSSWCRSHALDRATTKSDQDLLDSVLCAIVGYIWLFAPRSESLLIGDTAYGYMVTPAVGVARDRLRAAALARGVACE